MNMLSLKLPQTAHTPLCMHGANQQESGSSSPVVAPVHAALLCVAFIATFTCNPFAIGRAYAATWPVPTSELSASVAFHETYTAGDKNYVHSGIDIPASAGMQISSPQAGTVRYTGAVPSGDSRIGGGTSQKTMNAVSIEIQDGRVLTLMPFSTINVSQGDYVSEGDCLGTLAPGGDASSAQTHLHMGLKLGHNYYDPMSLFGVVSRPATHEEQQPQELSAANGAAFSAPMGELTPSVDAQAQEVPREGIEAQSFAPEQTLQESFGAIETGIVQWKPSVKETPSFMSAVSTQLEPLLAACCAQLSDLMSVLLGISNGFGVPLPVLLAIGGFALIAFVFAIAFVVLNFAAPYVGELWRKQNTPLSAHVGGDSMHKLFPASGTAFISRSRISPREVTK